MLSIIVTVGPEIVFHKTGFLNSRFGQDPGFDENLKLKDLGSIQQVEGLPANRPHCFLSAIW